MQQIKQNKSNGYYQNDIKYKKVQLNWKGK